MSDWRIEIPFRHREDPLSTVGELARHLPNDQDRVVRQLVLGGAGAGLFTVGDLLDRLDAMSPAERRALLDQTRSEVGANRLGDRRVAQVDEQSRVLSISANAAAAARGRAGRTHRPRGRRDRSRTPAPGGRTLRAAA
jgi:hypothetical protein